MKLHMKKEIAMKVIHFLAGLSLSVCSPRARPSRVQADIAQGREAMFAGNNQAALGYFQAAEQVDPNYIFGTELQEGVLSYLGRAQYLTGNYAQARQTLERRFHRTWPQLAEAISNKKIACCRSISAASE
jgi:tetratricopeptide (TPR) repeat protein